MKELKELLPFCTSEDDVKTYYSNVMQKEFPNCIFRSIPRSGVHTDGIIEVKKLGLKILRELKYKKDISERRHLIDCIIQVLYYLKLIESYGDSFPNIIFIGNENYCYCFHSDIILPYLDEDIDWSIAPSSAASNNPVLHNKLMNDTNINPYLFTIENINFKEVTNTIESLNINVKRKIMLGGLNMSKFFHEFTDRVLINPKRYYNANEVVNIFINTINDPKQEHTYSHPTQKNILVTRNFSHVRINQENFDSFLSYVSLVETITDQKKLDAICDRLIEEYDRRFKGEFYTPTIWVLEAHKMISEVFGPNWYNEYVVWDNSWGTGNLTRDFKFKELYCSTINESDLGIANARRYNPEATKFQYDFLNDDVYLGDIGVEEDKLKRLAPSLVKAFEENRPIIIFMNPPYTGPGDNKRDGKSKKGAGKTNINKEMLRNNMGYPSCQLHLQFLYRIIYLKEKYKLTNIHIAMFINPLLLSGSSYIQFRNKYFDNFEYKSGILFNAGTFSKVKEGWGIIFSIFSTGKQHERNSFQFLVKDEKHNFLKDIYNVDDSVTLTDWVKEKVKCNEKTEVVNLSNPITPKSWFRGVFLICKDSIGFLGNSGNNLTDIPTYTSIYSAGQSLGISITKDNFTQAIAAFSAKILVLINWVNCKDEFCIPNFNHPDYIQWNTDCVICSLFSNASNQSSLRNIHYKNKQWNIENQFFWLPNKYIRQLANNTGFDELYQDSVTFNQERFVFQELQKIQLSSDAQAVLDKATALVVKSFPKRKELHWIHPEYHLNTWDAGWYQIKLILKEYFKDDLEEFKQLYRSFEDRMREGVYKFGFLK